MTELQEKTDPYPNIVYRANNDGEISRISRLMESVFNEFIAPDYDTEGIGVFLKYIHPMAIADRLKRDHFLRVAEIQQEIVGVVEVRHYQHISLLFVTRKFQRRGIASELVRQAIALCLTAEIPPKRITVHADPKALPAYQAMGFKPTGQERVENGIRYIPMKYDLRQISPKI